MVPPRPLSPASTDAAHGEGARVPAIQSLVAVAERELLAALAEQPYTAFGMYVHRSPMAMAAFERAVHAICREAHRLDLRAEELVIAIKKAWSQLSAVRANQLSERDGDILREVVSSSIEHFFEPCDAEGRHAQR
jgi:hypothetical protein